METEKEIYDGERRKEFKSYYVVWKLFIRSFITVLYVSFKSYYVVWKLSSSAVFFSCVRFKSYYVVWKLKQ